MLFHLVISLTSDLSVSLVVGLSLTVMTAYGLTHGVGDRRRGDVRR